MLHRVFCYAAAIVALSAPAWGAATLTIADFERDACGFRGLDRDVERAHAEGASGRIAADFTTGTHGWVHAGKRLGWLDRDFTEVSFWVMSREINSVTFRVVDSAGQTHQQRPRVAPDGQWHRIAISKFNGGRSYQHWGGANDGTWRPPAKAIGFIVEKGNVAGGKGTLYLDDVVATLSEERVLPEFGLAPGAPLGNVFLTGERVALPVVTKGDSIQWVITDVWRKPVARGTATPIDGAVTIAPTLGGGAGYFLVKLDITKNGEPLAERFTSFAVVPPYTVRDREKSPFGVMTHFAQGWDAGVMPLIEKAGIVSIRDEHYWSQVEKERGVYAFPGKSRKYMDACREHRIDPLVVMTFANPLHDNGLTPHTPEGRDAYGRYGQAILKEYGKQVKWLEVWNEYNGTWCEGPAKKDRPKYYAQMLKHAYQHIKKVRPDVKVLGCATVLIPLPYLEGVF
ncbi:hypothetical protein HQ560_09400, partial [bacterium]|nr:hypothetical protein [bacterium]